MVQVLDGGPNFSPSLIVVALSFLELDNVNAGKDVAGPMKRLLTGLLLIFTHKNGLIISKDGFDVLFRHARPIFMANLLHFWSVDLLAHNHSDCVGVYCRGNTSEEMDDMVIRCSIFCTGYCNFYLLLTWCHKIPSLILVSRYVQIGKYRQLCNPLS